MTRDALSPTVTTVAVPADMIPAMRELGQDEGYLQMTWGAFAMMRGAGLHHHTVYLYFALHYAEARRPVAIPEREICEYLGEGRAKLRRIIRELESMGLLECVEKGQGRRGPSTYRTFLAKAGQYSAAQEMAA